MIIELYVVRNVYRKVLRVCVEHTERCESEKSVLGLIWYCSI